MWLNERTAGSRLERPACGRLGRRGVHTRPPVSQHRELRPRLGDFLRVDVDEEDGLDLGRADERLAPRGRHGRVAHVPVAVAILAHAVHARDIAEVLDRPRLQEKLPVGFVYRETSPSGVTQSALLHGSFDGAPEASHVSARLLKRAAEDGASLALLPEMFATGFSLDGAKIAQPLGGPSEQW